jgi:hypothetical protein
MIEHDASLVHSDTPIGESKAPIEVDKKLLNSMITFAAPHHGLTLHDFACARVSREALLRKPLGALHAGIGQGEAALTWMLLKEVDRRK